MSRTRPQQKRRGGARDDKCDNVTMNMTRDDLAKHLRRIRRKCEFLMRRYEIK